MASKKRPYPIADEESTRLHAVLLAGRQMCWQEINNIVDGARHVDLTEDAWERVHLARVAALAPGYQVYGMTTGVGAHAHGPGRESGLENDFGIGILTAHATELNVAPAPMCTVRAAVVLWCNQAASEMGGVPGVSPELVEAMLSWVNRKTSTPPLLDSLAKTDVGFGSLVANCQLALHILRECDSRGACVRAGEALPLMSHSNLLLAKAARQCARLERLLTISAAVCALFLAAFEGNAAVYEDARRWRSASSHESISAALIASWTAGDPHWQPRRLQDPLDFRCMASALGVLRAATLGADGLAATLERLSATTQCNPVVLPDDQGGFEDGSVTSVLFDTTTLRATLDGVRGGLGEVCGRSRSRIVTLSDPLLNGGLPVGLSIYAQGGVHNFNLPVIAAAIAHRASAAAAHRPVGAPVQAADGVECVAAYPACASEAIDDLLESATTLNAIEAVTALAALRRRASASSATLTTPALSRLIELLEPEAQRDWTGRVHRFR